MEDDSQFRISEFLLLMGELSVSYLKFVFLWANCQFLILKFVFLVGELPVSFFEICVSCGRTVSFLF